MNKLYPNRELGNLLKIDFWYNINPAVNLTVLLIKYYIVKARNET